MKRRLLLLIILIVVLVVGCSKTKHQLYSTSISQIDMKKNGHLNQISNFNSPYTICYENEDKTYSMYIFTSPIQYEKTTGEYAIVDNTIVKSRLEPFAFENKANNIKTYFPAVLSESFRVERTDDFIEFNPRWDTSGFSNAKSKIHTNMYGDQVSAVLYERKDMDLIFYPTKAGIKIEFVLKVKPKTNEFVFNVKTNASNCSNKKNSYIVFKNDNEVKSVISQPFLQYETKNEIEFDTTAELSVEKVEDNYLTTIKINEKVPNDSLIKFPLKFDSAFEVYLNAMPDSTVYSAIDENSYLARYALIGEHPFSGEGWHYVRPRLNLLFGIQPKKILSATYNTYAYSLTKKEMQLSLYKLDEEWSSTKMLWKNKTMPKENEPFSTQSASLFNFISMDITEFAKKCFSDSSFQTESNGFLIKTNKQKGGAIISTSDNSMHNPYIVLKLSSLPAYFEPKENINPT